MKLLLLVFGRAHQQIVEHVVVPAGHRATLQPTRALPSFISTLLFTQHFTPHSAVKVVSENTM